MSVEETLAAAAQATAAAAEAKPKKERVKKTASAESTTAGLDGEQVTKKVRAPKEPKVPKQYPQANEDGTQKFEEDGTTPVLGPRETQYKAPKAAKAPRVGKVSVTVDGVAASLASIQNEAKIVVHKPLGSKEGSKRSERAKAFEGANTVQDFFAAGGVSKDLLRHLKTGAVTLEIDGKVVAVEAAASAAKEEPAE